MNEGCLCVFELKKPILLMTPEELCSYLKYYFPNEKDSEMYGRYVWARGLMPDIHMKEFSEIYNRVKADSMKDWVFMPIEKYTHKEKESGLMVQAKPKEDGRVEYISNEGYGSFPSSESFFKYFEPITEEF
jgi:hypothetical protein